MRLAILQRTLTYRLTVVWSIGATTIALAAEFTAFVRPEAMPEYSRLALIICVVHIYVAGFYCNYRLMSGAWNVHRWSRNVMLLFSLPATWIFAWLAASMRAHWAAPAFIFFSTPASFFGVYGLARILTVFVSFIVCYVALLALVDPVFFREEVVVYVPLLSALLVYGLFMAQASRYYGGQSEQARGLLRNTRRDRRTIVDERKKSDRLLLNILPAEVAEELKAHGRATPRLYESATVMFTDFRGFTRVAENMAPAELVEELDRCFSYFDQVAERYNLEKLKTIGDSYMCAGGLPAPNRTHALDAVRAALEIQAFMNRMQEIKDQQNLPYWELRLGIHSGALIAGVVGERKFAYDVWGDTVNTASRLESSGVPGQVNISDATRLLIEPYFVCEHRGRIAAKNKGEIEMYFVRGLRPEYSDDGLAPNRHFLEVYDRLQET